MSEEVKHSVEIILDSSTRPYVTRVFVDGQDISKHVHQITHKPECVLIELWFPANKVAFGLLEEKQNAGT